MTDNDWRNARIEEAAKAIWDAHESGLSRGYLAEARPHYSDSEVYARAALAVFEKGLGEATVTPTDDEREAQGWREAALYDGDSQTQDDFMTGWRTADRTRHAEVPEPSAEEEINPEICKGCDEYDPLALSEASRRLSEGLDPDRRDGWTVLPDDLLADFRAVMAATRRWKAEPFAPDWDMDAAARRVKSREDALLSEPQGEPSDARAERARIIADLREWTRVILACGLRRAFLFSDRAYFSLITT